MPPTDTTAAPVTPAALAACAARLRAALRGGGLHWAAFATLAGQPVTDPGLLADLVAFLAGPACRTHWPRTGPAVELLLAHQPGLTEAHLRTLAAGLGRTDQVLVMISGATAALLAHPACTDSVATDLLGLPWDPRCLRPGSAFQGPPHTTALTFTLGSLARVGHPVHAALLLLSLREGTRRPRATAADVLATTARVRDAAAQHQVAATDVAQAVRRLVPDWAGSPEQLLDSAVAVCAR